MMNRLMLFSLLLFGACQRPLPDQSTWSGSITLADEKQLPIRLELDFRSSPPSGNFLISDERTPVPEIRRSGDSLTILISEYGAALRGLWNGSTWTGSFFRYRSDTVALPFSLSPDQGTPPPTASSPAVRLVGTFQVYYRDGNDTTTIAKFWSKGDSLFGTFIDPSGDHGLMVGTQSGSVARLGRFTGWQANLIELELHEGQWTGKYYARQLPPQHFTLAARPVLPSAPLDARRTRMKQPAQPFAFAGITADGDSIRSTDERFRGKVLIVDIMGTWCHNCLDEAPLLQQLYSEYHDKGLEIVGISFEITNDEETARRNLDIYRKRHGLTFPLLYCGSLDASNVDAKIRSQLHDFFAYPTTLFIGRNGKTDHIHWGFKGPGTGEEYQGEVESFYKHVKRLLGEKVQNSRQ